MRTNIPRGQYVGVHTFCQPNGYYVHHEPSIVVDGYGILDVNLT